MWHNRFSRMNKKTSINYGLNENAYAMAFETAVISQIKVLLKQQLQAYRYTWLFTNYRICERDNNMFQLTCLPTVSTRWDSHS